MRNNPLENQKKSSIRRDLTLGLVLTIIGVSLGVGSLFYFLTINQAEQDLAQRTTDTMQRLTEVLGEPLWDFNYSLIHQVVNVYAESENLVGIRVLNDDGEVVYEAGQTTGVELPPEISPIIYQGAPVGQLEVFATRREVMQQQRNILFLTLITLIFVVGAVVAVNRILLNRFLTQPLHHLTEGLGRIAGGKYTHLLSPMRQVEVDSIGQQVNTMARQIAERDQKLREIIDSLEERVVARTQQLEAANKELEATNKELEAFAYSISHDLRAPLRHIDGFLELLQKKTAARLDEQDQHYIANVSEAARHMGTLVDDLLSFSRMGRNEIFKAQVDLSGLVQDIIQEFKPETDGRDIEWNISPLPLVTGDRAMLRLVLVNLISNALKFTRSRSPAEIEIGWMPGCEAETIIFVRDNGVGFDMQYIDKLFGVFQRLHRVDEFEGTGIGLANVRRVISRHGGKTWAEAVVGQGATFYFSLPQRINK